MLMKKLLIAFIAISIGAADFEINTDNHRSRPQPQPAPTLFNNSTFYNVQPTDMSFTGKLKEAAQNHAVELLVGGSAAVIVYLAKQAYEKATQDKLDVTLKDSEKTLLTTANVTAQLEACAQVEKKIQQLLHKEEAKEETEETIETKKKLQLLLENLVIKRNSILEAIA